MSNDVRIINSFKTIKNIFRNYDYIENAPIPKLSFKPDFMLNIDGQLVFFRIVYLRKSDNVDWVTLRIIEEIFEIKLYFGNNAAFGLIILDEENWKSYCIELLENFCDRVIFGFQIRDFERIYTRSKSSNFDLWNLEREFRNTRYKKFDKDYLAQFYYVDISEKELEHDFARAISKFDLRYEKEYPIRNLKNYYIKRNLNLKFYFDYYVNDKIIEIKSFKKIKTTSLQNLMIKSRLIRYKKINNEIIHEKGNDMLLFINGNIKGPIYDELRYIRMLNESGWDVYPINYIYEIRNLRRLIQNA